MSQIQTVKWLVEEYIHEDDSRLVEEVKRQGYECKVLSHDWYKPKQRPVESLYEYFTYDECVLFMGTLNTAKRIQQGAAWYPGVFLNSKDLHCTSYNYYLQGELLNEDYYILPLYEVFKRVQEEVFIRPDNPYKTFPGVVVNPVELGLDKFMSKYGLDAHNLKDLVLISKPKEIFVEVRAVVTNTGEIISLSHYQINKKIKYSSVIGSFKDSISAYVNAMALRLAKVDSIFTIDIAWDAHEFKVIEIGSFSCSSLYEADFKQVVEVGSKLAYANYLEYIQN